VTLGQRRISILPAPPSSEIRFELKPAAQSQLRLELVCKISQEVVPEGAIVFEIDYQTDSDRGNLFRREVVLKPERGLEISQPADIDLTRLADRDVQLTLTTRFEGSDSRPPSGIFGWGRPSLVPRVTSEDPPRSLIIWLTDTLRADHLGCYGYHRHTSPHIDTFAAEAIRFEDLIAQSSWTKASIASMLTGLFPSFHGAEDRDDKLYPNLTTLTQILKKAGFNTSAFSANPSFFAREWGLSKGFDEVWYYHQRREVASTKKIMADLEPWLISHAGEQIFLFVHTMDPHAPYKPPEPYNRMFSESRSDQPGSGAGVHRQHNRGEVSEDLSAEVFRQVARYDGEIAYNDSQFGLFLEQLKKTGFYDNSIIVFTSDHGEEFYEHGGWAHGHELYQEQIRIPLIIRLPAGRFAGREIKGMVSGVDLLPSFLQLVGLDPHPGHGSSFIRSLEQGEAFAPLEVFSEQHLDKDRLFSLIRGRYKFIQRLEPEPENYLFDLVADPTESTNLVHTLPERAENMAGLLTAHREVAEAGTRVVFVCPEPQLAMGVITTESPIKLVRSYNLRGIKEVWGTCYGLSENRRRLWFKIEAGATPRGLAFELEGTGQQATLQIKTAENDTAWPVFLGAENRRASASPVTLAGPDLVVRNRQVNSLEDYPGGCYIWSVPRNVAAGPPALTPDEREDLKVLGYLE